MVAKASRRGGVTSQEVIHSHGGTLLVSSISCLCIESAYNVLDGLIAGAMKQSLWKFKRQYFKRSG